MSLSKRYSWLLLFICLSFFSCSNDGTDAQKINNNADRIVVIAPAIGEMLSALDLEDQVIGRGQYGPWSEAIMQQPIVGGYNNPNAEIIKHLDADIVLNTQSQAALESHKRLREIDIEVMVFDTSTIEGIYQSLIDLGQRFNREKRAEEIIAEIQNGLKNLARKSDNLNKKSVLFVVGTEPLYVAAPGSHIDYLINLTGGVNIIDEDHSPYQQISVEVILQRQPEIIIDASNAAFSGIEMETGYWGKFPNIPAVKNRQVYSIDSSLLLIPGIELVRMAELMGQLIHPEIFGVAYSKNTDNSSK